MVSLRDNNEGEEKMTPTDLHLSEARAWIERNGYPETDEQIKNMALWVAVSAAAKTQAMANSVVLAMDAAEDDKKHNANSLEGDKGRDFPDLILHMVKS